MPRCCDSVRRRLLSCQSADDGQFAELENEMPAELDKNNANIESLETLGKMQGRALLRRRWATETPRQPAWNRAFCFLPLMLIGFAANRASQGRLDAKKPFSF